MSLIKNIFPKIKQISKKTPIIGDLMGCSTSNYRDAISEMFYTFIFSFSPIFIAFFVAYLGNSNTNFITNIISNTQNGELFIYVTSLLAPVYYLSTHKRRDGSLLPRNVFINSLFYILSGFAALFFALKRANFIFDKDSVHLLSNITFISSIILFFIVQVFNNSILQSAPEIYQSEEDDFAAAVALRRKKQNG